MLIKKQSAGGMRGQIASKRGKEGKWTDDVLGWDASDWWSIGEKAGRER